MDHVITRHRETLYFQYLCHSSPLSDTWIRQSRSADSSIDLRRWCTVDNRGSNQTEVAVGHRMMEKAIASRPARVQRTPKTMTIFPRIHPAR